MTALTVMTALTIMTALTVMTALTGFDRCGHYVRLYLVGRLCRGRRRRRRRRRRRPFGDSDRSD